MNEHSRSIDTRHHAIRQDYVEGDMRIGGVASQENESDILTKFLQPPLHEKHAHFLHIKQDRRTVQNNVLHCTTQKWKFDTKNHQTNPKFPEFRGPTQHGSIQDPRQPNRDQQNPLRNPITRTRSTRQNPRLPYKPPATMAHNPPKNTPHHPKIRHDRRGITSCTHLPPYHPHPAHNPMGPTHTPMCPKHRPPARPYPTSDKHTLYPTLGPSQPSLPSNFECFVQDGRRLQTKTCVEKGFFEIQIGIQKSILNSVRNQVTPINQNL